MPGAEVRRDHGARKSQGPDQRTSNADEVAGARQCHDGDLAWEATAGTARPDSDRSPAAALVARLDLAGFEGRAGRLCSRLSGNRCRIESDGCRVHSCEAPTGEAHRPARRVTKSRLLA